MEHAYATLVDINVERAAVQAEQPFSDAGTSTFLWSQQNLKSTHADSVVLGFDS
jgi:hypothetical protein